MEKKMSTIREQLFALKDEKYGDFQANLTPNMKRECIIGVRVPNLRQLAKQLKKEMPEEAEAFLKELPHQYYDENMLHSILLSAEKEYESALEKVEAFLPYVDNWAVCDTLSPKVFAKHKDAFLVKIREWAKSKETYTIRFGLEMLMSFYLDDAFCAEYLDIPAAVESEEYYVRMMIAWFFATALAKQWEATIPYLQETRLTDDWVHNKTIQKARESYRITPEQKEYLKTLKRA